MHTIGIKEKIDDKKQRFLLKAKFRLDFHFETNIFELKGK